MHNQEQHDYEQDELHRDAIKQEVREALRQGPARGQDELAKRIGMRSDGKFMRLLHEMLDDSEINQNWVRGYYL